MTEKQAIGPIVNWQEGRNDSGEYWHPQFWVPVEAAPKDEAEYIEWYTQRLIDLNLECQSFWLGEGYPRAHEDELRVRYDEGDGDAIKAWEPQGKPDGIGWFILAINDTEDGPTVTWARVRPEQEPSA